MPSPPFLTAREMAAALLASNWERHDLDACLVRTCGKPGRWAASLAGRIVRTFPTAPEPDRLARFLTVDAGLRQLAVLIKPRVFRPLAMEPHPAATGWGVPPITSAAALAEWLGLTVPRLDWLADLQGRNGPRPEPALRHYDCRWLPKRTGGHRLLEVPRPLLRRVQRRVLHGILDRVPPHPAAHAYRAGRSVASYVAPHAGKAVVLRFDLRDFFASVRASRVHRLFTSAGYPREVARLLTGVCTSRLPEDAWRQRPGGMDAPDAQAARDRLRRRHLPQGAPTSPALANLTCWRLDQRLAGLAAAVGADYTRYADDLAFSGDERLARAARRIQVAVGRVALEEGFEPHFRKSRFMRQGVRQQLCGVVLNARPNLPRGQYDELKALLFNCARFGPASQNRAGLADFRQHLLGRIGYWRLIHPGRAEKLGRLFDRIRWPE